MALVKGALLLTGISILLAFTNFSPEEIPKFSSSAVCACTDTLNGSLDQECKFTISPGVLFEDTATMCGFPVTLVVRFGLTDTITVGVLDSLTDTVQVRGAYAYLGQYITVDAYDSADLQLCSPVILVEDKLAPTLVCTDTVISCNADTSPVNLGFPAVLDNCATTLDLEYRDSFVNRNCSDPSGLIAVIFRTWTATDEAGNAGTCVQEIGLERLSLSDVSVPTPVTVDCSGPGIDPSVTGYPMVDGEPLTQMSPCNLMIFGPTDGPPILGCDNVENTIVRTWTIMDTCTGVTQEFDQVIEIADLTPPTVSCVDTIRVGTDQGLCTATVVLPQPTVTDDCSTPVVNVEITGIGVGFDPIPMVPPGVYNVIYTVTDCSGISVTCNSVLIVEDDEEPVAICRQFTVVSLNTTGTAIVPARSFDEGSYDNCDDVGFLASRDGVNFTPTVTFNCDDSGLDSIMVVLRVYELSNPSVFDHCMVMVEVQEKLRPMVNCPANRTIDCDTDYSDLSVFGSPVIIEACSYTLTDTAIYNLDQCGTGTIRRIFTATDLAGNVGQCTQTITVQNLTPFNGNGIIWPLDTTFSDCTTAISPADLLPPYDRPILPSDSCAMLAVNYKDQQFNSSYPACYKVFRTWTVMDWCTGNEWTHTQLIVVMDRVKPQLICPPDITFPASANCTSTFVSLAPVTVTDCDPNITITNNSPYATSGGADASGNYPIGTTTVRFTATDRCGNFNTCTVRITVADQSPPTVTILDRIAIELGSFDGDVYARLNAIALNAGVKDNCTAMSNLRFFIRPRRTPVGVPPTASFLIYTCDDVGLDSVEIWVIDEAGNADFAIAEVDIQDNNNLCQGSVIGSRVSISGHLKTEAGMPLANAEVRLIGVPFRKDTTDANGFYKFDDLPKGGNYTIVPSKEDDITNGVSTFDLTQISKHILNIQYLASPHKMLAADANNSQSISTLDVVTLRKAILRSINVFPNNTSWRFVQKSHVFQDPMTPFRQPVQAIIEITGLDRNIYDADFIAVKVGDVNGNASLGPNSVGNRSLAPPVVLSTDDRELKKGEKLKIALKATEDMQLEGFQFSLVFDNQNLRITSVEGGVLPAMTEENFGWHSVDKGILPVSWNRLDQQTVRAGEVLFYLDAEVVGNGMLSESISIEENPVPAEAYTAVSSDHSVKLVFDEAEPEAGQFILYQNKPNPFTEKTAITFYLPEAVKGTLTIFDLSGRVIREEEKNWAGGRHEVSLSRNDLPESGVFLYRLKTPGFTATRKMILL